MSKQVVNIRMAPDLLAIIKQRAENQNTSVSRLVEIAAREMFMKVKHTPAIPPSIEELKAAEAANHGKDIDLDDLEFEED